MVTNPFPDVLAIGDSLTAGYGLPAGASFAARLQDGLRRHHPSATVRNAGVSGDTTEGALRRLPALLDGLVRPPDLAIGPESYENRTSDELDRLPAMAEAIAAGRVLTRTKASAMTRLMLAIETEIRLAEGQVWKAERWIVTGTRPGAMTREDRWYLPYRR